MAQPTPLLPESARPGADLLYKLAEGLSGLVKTKARLGQIPLASQSGVWARGRIWRSCLI